MTRLVKFRSHTEAIGCGLIEGQQVVPLHDLAGRPAQLAGLLDSVAVEADWRSHWRDGKPIHADTVEILPPIDEQEVWGAGVTYLRSKKAREDESEQAATFYDQVYGADRPELFFKATPHRVVGQGGLIRVRADSRWTVPEPELGLVLSSSLRLVGYTLGNDVSARDIEGRNPLYLPQAKVYDGCCALGPYVALADEFPPLKELEITLKIARDGRTAFEARTPVGNMVRTPDELIGWLGRDNTFPNGVILLTGTGIVPPDDFSLRSGDLVSIGCDAIGQLTNRVA